ncbi:MAG: hypothetical protein DCC67_17780, partial [Planctomycetota bacterium]
ILDGATLVGDLDLTASGGHVTLRLVNGGTFTGNASISSATGHEATLAAETPLTLSGRTITLGERGVLGVSGTNTLTLGTGTTVHLSGANSRLSSDLYAEPGDDPRRRRRRQPPDRPRRLP